MGYRLLVIFLIFFPLVHSCRTSDDVDSFFSGNSTGAYLSSILRHQKTSFLSPLYGNENNSNPSVTDTVALKKSDWYSSVLENIASSEYEIRYQEQYKAFSSPNRKQNLRASYRNDLFSLSPRNDSADQWQLDLQLLGVFAGKNKIYTPSSAPRVEQNANNIRFVNNDEFTTEYINSPDGVRQNFIINKGPSGDPAAICVKLKANAGWYVNRADKGELHFAKALRKGYVNKLTYNDLQVWDADHKKLDAEFLVSGNEITIQVFTKDARYPITIDPISTTPAATVQSDQNLAYMGFSVSSAGDVNGDGYSDVIVGAYLYDAGLTDEGRAYVYHGSPTGISTTAASIMRGNQVSANFGIAVSTAGNVNGDAYSDVIVGASIYDSGQTDEGAAFIYHGSASGIVASGTPANANSVIQSNQSNAILGIAVATAGDVNADGYSDVIVGAYNYDNGNSDEGAAFVFHGSVTGIIAAGTPVNANRVLDCNQDFGYMGVSVASAGDVNGDGYNDVVVGAYGYETGILFDNGAAFVYHGSAAGVAAAAAASVYGTQDFGLMGNSVSSAGDVNSDGYSDVIVAAYNFDNGQVDEGVAYVYHGTAGGMNTVAAVMLESNQASAYFGNSVACAGDVNGDGYSDLIIGCQYYTNGQTGEGAIFVYQGSATGISTTYTTLVESNQASALLGSSVASAGDVNGDGFSDVIAGAYNYDSGQTDEGAAFVYHGSARGTSAIISSQLELGQFNAYAGFSVASAGDVNADGFSDVIVGVRAYDLGNTDEGAAFIYHGSVTGLNIVAATQLVSGQNGAFMGNSVASAGDVNGDGYGDIIVGCILFDNGFTDEGGAFIYHGSASGIGTIRITQLEGKQANAFFGCGVAGAGDVNSDGYSDVIVGARFFDNGLTDEGAAFIFHGSPTGISTTIMRQLEGNQLNAQFGFSVAGASDVNGDGFSDVIVGAFLYDAGLADEGAAFVYHGSNTGIAVVASSQLEGNQLNAQFGSSVASAGDVNGDGYGDVIAGATFFDNGHTDEGAAFVYHGSAAGVNTTIMTQLEGNQLNAFLGNSVASGGDVNGDGYSDIVIGAWQYDNGSTDEGVVFVYHGSAGGIITSIAAQLEINQVSAYFGYTVASAGDINGDGFSDVIIGAPNFDNSMTDEGAAFLFLGNGGMGKRSNLRLYNTNLTTPITRANYNNPNAFGAGLFAKSPLGRAKGKLVWEVKANGQPFSGNPIGNTTIFYDKQAGFTNLGIGGIELKSQVQKRGKQTKIRTRIEYEKATAITGQVYGPWRYPPGYTMGAYGMNSVPLPLTLITFNGQFANEDDVQLRWITENEINVHSFVVERSLDGINFTNAGELLAKGINGSRSDYALLDQQVKANLLFYRLKIFEQDGTVSYSNIITLSRDKVSKGSLSPNPVQQDGMVQLNYSSMQNTSIQIRLINASGTVLSTQIAKVYAGNNAIPISVKGLAKGVFVVKLVGEGESYKLVVQ